VAECCESCSAVGMNQAVRLDRHSAAVLLIQLSDLMRPYAEPSRSWVSSSRGDEPLVQRNSFWTASGTELVSGAHKSQGSTGPLSC